MLTPCAGSPAAQWSSASPVPARILGWDGHEGMHRQWRGLPAFELILLKGAPLLLDARCLIETGIAHLGNALLRMIHRVTDPRTGAESCG